MILIIHADDVDPAKMVEIENALQGSYDNRLDVLRACESEYMTWPRDRSWDDLIVLAYGDQDLTDQAASFLQRAVFADDRERPILPIAMADRVVPPEPVGRFKSMQYDLARITKRVGAILGMSIRTRDQKIFISYRASDGTELAAQVEEYLTENGFHPWRDEAKDEYDGQRSLPPGSDVQKIIESNLETADLILLLDTPQASGSKWINLEVNLANGLLIPVLPVVIRRPGEKVLISRFRSLASLQRGISLEAAGPRIEASQLDQVGQEIEDFLCEVYRRKLRLPFLVETEFTGKGYTWSARDHIIFEALKNHEKRITMRVYSHCSHFEGIFDPALAAFVQHVGKAHPPANYKLYVYDGPILSDEQIQKIQQLGRIEEDTTVIILHNQEIAALLNSNFTGIAS